MSRDSPVGGDDQRSWNGLLVPFFTLAVIGTIVVILLAF